MKHRIAATLLTLGLATGLATAAAPHANAATTTATGSRATTHQLMIPPGGPKLCCKWTQACWWNHASPSC